MKAALGWIAEERIRQAQTRGELDRLPGEGQPLQFDEDPLAPQELRVAWRLLRGAGLSGPGTSYNGPMPNSFAAMMALIDRSRGTADPYDPRARATKWLLAESRRQRWAPGAQSGQSGQSGQSPQAASLPQVHRSRQGADQVR